MEEDFERMTLKEKKAKLEEVIFEINKENSDKLKSGEYEISDISYYKSSNGKDFYRVDIIEKDENGNYNKNYEIYEANMDDKEPEEKYKKVDLDKYDEEIENIENYQNLNGYDDNVLEEQKETLKKEQAELEELRNSSKNRNSLSNLDKEEQNIKILAKAYGIPEDEIEEYAEINGDRDFADAEQTRDFANKLGIKDEDIDKYLKVDKNGKKSLDANKINFKGIQSGEIEGNEKITTYYTLNDILGKNYDTYRIIKTNDSVSHVFGVTNDGEIEELDNDTIKLDDAKNMSLIDNDGTIKNVGVICAFSVKMPGSSENGKELVGMYNNNGNVGAFYARKELDGIAIGEGIDKESKAIPHENNTEYKASQVLDYRKNEEIDAEANSAFERTYDGCKTDIDKISSDQKDNEDMNMLISKYSKMCGIDEEDLKKMSEKELELSHEENPTDRDAVEKAAEEIEEENEGEKDNSQDEQRQSSENPLVKDENKEVQVNLYNTSSEEKDDNEKDDDEKDESESHILGTPWGNPNNY